jgi:glycosyltransferase involved in cell wall biosynthesis
MKKGRTVIALVRRVITAEGLPSAIRRARGRIAEAIRERALLLRGRFTETPPHFPILNVLATPATPRLGGIQVQLLARLRAERRMRPVALFTPGMLTLSHPRPHARRVANLREAIAISGARVMHIEGAYGIDTADVLRLIDEGLDVILSLHDFALIADDPHRLDRNHSERRTHGMQLLRRARAVVYPSRFLEFAHRHPGTIIPAGITPVPRVTRRPAKKRRIAIAGSVQPRKGAHLIRPIVDAFRGSEIEWFVFGGGDADVLGQLRALPNVTVHGQYEMGALPGLLARHGIDVVLLLSVEPELYSLTLSESWLAGVPVIAFAHGAIEERVREEGGGWLVPLEDGARGIVQAIERWLAGETLPSVPETIATADDAARAYLALYVRETILPR